MLLKCVCLLAFFATQVKNAKSFPTQDKVESIQNFKNLNDLNNEDERSMPQFLWKNRGPTERRQIIADETTTYRLPNNSIPVRYDLLLKTDVHKESVDFDGQVKIRVKIVESTDKITLHYRQITVDKVNLVNTEDSSVTENLSILYEEIPEFLVITLPKEFKPNDEIILDITYKGKLRLDGAGFYRAIYREDGKEIWFATTQFESTNARHAMPCYDEPGIRAKIGLEIKHGKSLTAISNMPLISNDTIDSEYVVSKFKDTPEMQSYLLAFIVSDYHFVSNNQSKNQNDIEQRVYATPKAIKEGRADFALSVVNPILKKLEEHFKTKLPLPKMDHALIADYTSGAMENFGLITYQESNMLYKKGTDADWMEKNIIELIAHEYTHQWFGNIVSPKWWTHTWLSEGFATLYSNYIPSLIYPDEDYMDRFRIYRLQTAFQRDVAQIPMNYYPESPAEIQSKFSVISYEKSSCVLRMFLEAFTPSTFTKGLTYYLTEMYFKAATPEDLHRNLQKALDEDSPESGVDVDEVMSSWENQAGYPIVQVDKEGDKLVLTQKRFGGGSEIFSIPISYASKSSPDFDKKSPQIWMNTTSVEILNVNSSDWVILNLFMTGYYKTSYSHKVWQTIIDGLKSDHKQISIFHRAQLFRQMVEEFDAVLALELLNYLEREEASAVWESTPGIIDIFFVHLFGTNIESKYQRFLQVTVQPIIDRLGFNSKDGQSQTENQLRNWALTFSCGALQDECLNWQHDLLLKAIEAGEKPALYCAGMRFANKPTYSTLLQQMLDADDDRNDQIRSLGCSLSTDVLESYVNISLVLSNGLTLDERIILLSSMTSQSVQGLEAVLKFIVENYEEIKALIPEKLEDLISNAASYVNTERHNVQIKAIIELSKSPMVGVTNKIQRNMQWIDDNSENIETWLDVRLSATILGAQSLLTSLVAVMLCTLIQSFI